MLKTLLAAAAVLVLAGSPAFAVQGVHGGDGGSQRGVHDQDHEGTGAAREIGGKNFGDRDAVEPSPEPEPNCYW
jgi:hypothetical protein